jgi:pilus assembly protein Flp/PilA
VNGLTTPAILEGIGGLRREDGQGLVEYALILLLVSVVSIAILTILGTDVRNVFSSVVNGL